MDSFSKPQVALIAGPTASGKSALALALAERLNGAIINADSAQVYRDLRIISARPCAEDEARIPHFLYGYRDGGEPCSAANWAEDAKAAITAATAESRLPILVGGTGLYIRTLLDGIAPVPDIDPEIRASVRSLPVGEAYIRLQTYDPAAAARLRPSDTSRIARALEVILSTGRSISDWQREKHGGIGSAIRLHPIILLPPREWLYARCDQRFEMMISEEGLGEINTLLARKLDPSLPIMRAIGVPEIAAYVKGELTRDETIEQGQTATRQYAKRQYTWFRHQPPADWPRFERPLEDDAIDEALSILMKLS